MFLLSFKGKRNGLERKARKRGGKATKRGLSREQVPVLVARDRAGATMDCVLDAMDTVTLSAALKPFITKDVVRYRFFPDGGSSGGEVRLAFEDTGIAIQINWLTGSIRVSSGRTGQ